MTLLIHRDGNNQPYVEWEQGPANKPGSGGFKRAWIRYPPTPDRDWANTGRYISIASIDALGRGPNGMSADFPIYSGLPDEQILVAFVVSMCGLTGCQIP